MLPCRANSVRHQSGTVRKSRTFARTVWLNHAVSAWGSPQDAPSGIRTRATTLKGWRPGPLVDGGGRTEDTGGRSYHPWPPGRLAQLVERLPYTQVAAGSSPAPPIQHQHPCGNGLKPWVRIAIRAESELVARLHADGYKRETISQVGDRTSPSRLDLAGVDPSPARDRAFTPPPPRRRATELQPRRPPHTSTPLSD